jgi:hypothetical protein
MLTSASKDENGHPQQKEDVSSIEHPGKDPGPTSGPLPAEREVPTGGQVHEVTNSSEDDAVVEVADTSGQDQADSDVCPVRSSEGPEGED